MVSMRKYSCIHVTARSEYCSRRSAETRDDATPAGDISIAFPIGPAAQPRSGDIITMPSSSAVETHALLQLPLAAKPVVCKFTPGYDFQTFVRPAAKQ